MFCLYFFVMLSLLSGGVDDDNFVPILVLSTVLGVMTVVVKHLLRSVLGV